MEDKVILQVQESFKELGNILPITDELFPELLPRYINHRECVTVSGKELILDLEIPREVLAFYTNSGGIYPRLEYLSEHSATGKTRTLKTPNGTKIKIVQISTFVRTIIKKSLVYSDGKKIKVAMDTDSFSVQYIITRYRPPSSGRIGEGRTLPSIRELYGETCVASPLFSKSWGDLTIDSWTGKVYNSDEPLGTFMVHTRDTVDPVLTREGAVEFISKTQLGKIFGNV